MTTFTFYGFTNLNTIYNLSDIELTICSTDHSYVAYYAEVIYTTYLKKNN